MAYHRSINRERSVRGNHLRCLFQKGEGNDEEVVIRLSSRECGQCFTLVAVKGLLQRISHCDRVPPPERIDHIRALHVFISYVSHFCIFI